MRRRFDRVRLLAIVAIAACAAAPSPVPSRPVTNRQPATPVVPALFAPLFRAGASWTFTADTTIHDQNGHADHKPGTVTCPTRAARASREAGTADFACPGTVADQPIDGVLVATATGLWHVDVPVAEITDARVATLREATRSIGADPVVGDHTNTLSD